MQAIDTAGWSARLKQLAEPGGVSLAQLAQRNAHDLELTLATATLYLEPQQLYTEVQTNERLRCFLRESGAWLVDTDFAQLRRCLVDTGFVLRDAHGGQYRRGQLPDWLAHASLNLDRDALAEAVSAHRSEEQGWLAKTAHAMEVTESLLATAGDDEMFMRLALDQAHNAWALGEVPVGCVIVKDGKVVATGFNQPIGNQDPTAHAEIQALRAAAEALDNYRLNHCELFVTLEPCAMCAGAIFNARISRVVYGAPDLKAGACASVVRLFDEPKLNHHATVRGGVLAKECAAVLTHFFTERREAQRAGAASADSLPSVGGDETQANPHS